MPSPFRLYNIILIEKFRSNERIAIHIHHDQTRVEGESRPDLSVHDPGKVAILVSSLLLAVLAYQLNATMVTPILPDLARQLGTSLGNISLVSSLFFMSGSVAGIVLSRWSDFLGRKRVLLGVLTATAVGTVICIFAPNLTVLLCGRVLQGASMAAFQLAYIILGESLTAERFGVALGVITAVNGGFGGIDGYLGGLIGHRFGYQYVFSCILLVGILAIGFLYKALPANAPTRSEASMDWRGSAALSLGLIALMSAVSQGASAGWLDRSTLILFATTLVMFPVFWRVETKQRFPLIAVKHFRSRRFWPILTTTILTLASVFAVVNFTIVLISQNGQIGYGLAPARSALLFLSPPALIGLGSAPLSGWIATKWGWVRTLRVGLVCCIIALLVISSSPFHKWFVFAMVASLGVFYNGLVLTTLNGLGVFLSPKEAPAALPGLNGAAFGIGASLGIAIVAPFAARGTVSGYSLALWISVAVSVLAFASSLFIASSEPHESQTGTLSI